jgi:hypothetical protein
MLRQSLAEEYYLEAEETPEEPGVEWLLLYDFKETKPGTKFWTNLSRLTALGEGSTLIQRSVFLTKKRRIVTAARRLAEHYGARTEVFKGRREDP